MISEVFGRFFIASINDQTENPTHVLFNQWWEHAPDDVKQSYVDCLVNDRGFADLVSGEGYADPLSLDELSECASGTLGRAYHD